MKKLLLITTILIMGGCTISPAPKYLKEINDEINSYQYIEDNGDYWATPDEFYAKNGGDCEDFAIAKADLIKQSNPDAILDLVLVHSINDGLDHAVLWVDNEWVLDNKISSIYKIRSKTFTHNYDFHYTTKKGIE